MMNPIAVTRQSKQLFAFVAVLALCATELSAMELNRYFCDGMVLQRDKKNKIWGTGTKDESVSVTFSGQTKTAKVDESGRWVVVLEPMTASDQGAVISVRSSVSSKPIELKNVVVGDVFLFARQSSIDVSLGSTPAGQQAAAAFEGNAALRFIQIKASPSKDPLDNLKADSTTGWQVADKKSALSMTAAAFYLSRDLVKDVKVPIGVVDLCMSYFFASAWLSDKGLDIASSKDVLGADDVKAEMKFRQEDIAAWDKRLVGYVRGKPDRGTVSDKPLLGLSPIEMPYFPSACYNTVIHPLRGLVVKGMLLQLGNDYPYVAFTRLRDMGKITDMAELSKANADSYNITKEGNRMTPAVLPVAVDDLRASLGDASLPVGWIMPPGTDVYSYGTHNREVREVQRRAQTQTKNVDLILPGTEHIPMSGQPADEILLATRCKQWVLGTFYGAKGPVSGPLFDRLEVKNGTVTVYFKLGTAEGLKAEGDALKHFELAGADRDFVPCKAELDGSTVKLTTDAGFTPMYARFGWSRKPIQGLLNSACLPAIPFSTDTEWEYDWWGDPAPVELPEEYYTPANKWPKRDYAIINYETEGKDFHLGPTGLWGSPAGPNLLVGKITPESPAEGKVLEGDLIYGVNGTEFGAGPEENYRQFAAGITKAEAEVGGGTMILNIRREGKLIEVPIKLEFMGAYSATSPWDCEKSKRIVKKAEDWMRNGLRPHTGMPDNDTYAYAGWNDNILFLLASGNPELQGLVRRFIRQQLDEFDKKNDISKPSEEGGLGWYGNYLVMLLGEYYQRTGDPTVVPYLEWMIDKASLAQIQPPDGNPYKSILALTEDQVGAFRGGRRTPGTTMVADKFPPTGRTDYGLMPASDMPLVMGMLHAKEAGLKVDNTVLCTAVRHLYYKRAENGYVQYAYTGLRIDEPAPIDPKQAASGTVGSLNGKLGTAAALFSMVNGADKAVKNCSEPCVYAFNKTRKGHGGAWFNNYWTPIGAYHAGQEKYQHFMKGQQWWRELYRDHTGAVWQEHNAKGKDSVQAVGFVAHYVVQNKKLRMFGAPHSAFGTNAPAYLKPALAAHRERDYALAEKLIQKVLEGTVPENDLPLVNHFLDSVQTLKKSIDYDLAYTEDALKRGETALAKLELPQLKMVVAPGNERLKAIIAALESSTGNKTVKGPVAGKKPKQKQDPQSGKADGEKGGAGKSWAQELASIATLVKDGKEYVGVSKKDRLSGSPREQCNPWRMTVLESPKQMPQGWEKPAFDDSRWDETPLPIIWPMGHTALLRTTFEVTDVKAYEALHVRANAYKQRNILFYLNGQLVAKVNNIPRDGAIDFPLTPYALTLLKNGKNSLAVSAEHGLRLVNFSLRLEGRLKDK
jgi:sialate O-acetylesterase